MTDIIACILRLDGLEVRVFSIIDNDIVFDDHFDKAKVITATLGIPQMLIGWMLKQLANLYIALSVVGVQHYIERELEDVLADSVVLSCFHRECWFLEDKV